MMRVTDNMMYGSSTDAMLNLQSSVAKLTQEVSQGTVLTPADNPIAAAQALNLTQSQSVNTQLATNRANAGALLSSNEATISNIVSTLTDVQSQAISAGNATYSNQDRSDLAVTVQNDMQQMLGYANTTDANGNYVYAGYKSTTQPFTQDPTTGAVTYNGDQGVQTLQVDNGQSMAVSVSGQALFMGSGSSDMFNAMNNLVTALQTPVSATANATQAVASQGVYDTAFGVAITGLPTPTAAQIAASTASATAAQSAVATNAATLAQQAYDTDYTNTVFTPGSTGALNQAVSKASTAINAAMNNVLTVQTSVGASANELSSLNTVGSQQDTNYTNQIANLMGQGPSSMTQTISQLAQQQTLLQAAQKTFSTVTSLSLLNYLK